MKTLPVALATHVALGRTTLATAIRITRTDGEVFAFTSHDVDDSVSGVTYRGNPGLDVSALVAAANLSVGNLELTTLHDGSVFTTAEIFAGVWRNAAFTIFRYNWASLTDGIDTLLAGTFGEVTLRQNTVVVELRALTQYVQQGLGDTFSKNCRARLGDARCAKNLTAFTYTGTLTTVTSSQVFRDSARAEAVNWFDEGEIEFTSGACDGLRAKVKSYAANGTFTLAVPLYITPGIGDSYTAIAGCRKRLQEDCRDKFDNVLNFVGEPHAQGLDDLTQAAVADV
jgi:uncharacterized phage protein (TIGR02218 family)